MNALKCDICGGTLTADSSSEFLLCEYCNTSYPKERLAKGQTVRAVVKIARGDTEKERLLKNAETFLRLHDREKALAIYQRLTNDFPDDYRGWLGEVRCRTLEFTDFSIGKSGLESLQRIVNNALQLAPDHEKITIRSKWTSYSEECIRIENDELRRKLKEQMRRRQEQQKEEEARQRKLAEAKAKREAEERELERQRAAEAERRRLEKEQEEKQLKTKQILCFVILVCTELLFSGLLLAFDFIEICNESLGSFLGVNAAILVNAVIGGIISKIGRIRYGEYIYICVNALFACAIFVAAMRSMDGIIIGFFAFFFFGAIELGVIYGSYLISRLFGHSDT